MISLDGRPVTVDELGALALVNYGHFTTMLVAGGRVRGLALHLRRLVDDCRVVFDAELDPDRVRNLLRRAELPPRAVARVTVYAPDLPIGRPAAPATPRVLITARDAAPGRPAPVRLRSAAYQRELAAVKHVGLFGAAWHRRVAQRAGADDVLFVDRRSRVCEGATFNVGFVADDGQVIWPAADSLAGVTMRLLDQACHAVGPAPVRRVVELAGARAMPAAFVTNAAVGVRPVATLDDAAYDGAHPALRMLADRYADVRADPI